MRARIHVFGNKPSPSCAIHGLRCIMDYEVKEDCSDESKNFIKTQCYVDDAMAVYDDEDQAISVMVGAKHKLSMFNVRLHKIASNSAQVRNAFPHSELNKVFQEEGSGVCGALGLEWKVEEDVLKFRVEVPEKKFTPRVVLTVNHSVYDPLNWATPLIFKVCVLQRKMFSKVVIY